MPFRSCRLLASLLLASTATAGLADASVERVKGQVTRLHEGGGQALVAGTRLPGGTQLRSAGDSRAEFALAGRIVLSMGGEADVLIHSQEASLLRLRLNQGAVAVDSRARGTQPALDVRLNAGALRLRVRDAQAWVQQSAEGAQVCVIAGQISVQVAGREERLDLPGQCLLRSATGTSWLAVPPEVMGERLAMTLVALPASGASTGSGLAAAPSAGTSIAAAASDDERRWSVVLASVAEAAAAERQAAELRTRGVAAEARAYRVDQRQGYRVGVGRYLTREEAEAAMGQIKAMQPGLSAWLARY